MAARADLASLAEDVTLALATAPGRLAPPALAKLLDAAKVPSPDGQPWNGAKLVRALGATPVPHLTIYRHGSDITALEAPLDWVPELLQRAIATGRFARFHAASTRMFPSPEYTSYGYGWGSHQGGFPSHVVAMRDVRAALATGDASGVARAIQGLSRYELGESAYQLTSGMPYNPPRAWLSMLPHALVAEGSRYIARVASNTLAPLDSSWFEYLQEAHVSEWVSIATLHAARGDDSAAGVLLNRSPSHPDARCLALLLAHDLDGAIAVGDAETRTSKKRRDAFMKSEHGAAYLAACLASGRPPAAEHARQLLVTSHGGQQAAPLPYAMMLAVFRKLEGQPAPGATWIESALEIARARWTHLFYLGLAAAWMDVSAEASYALTELLRERATLARERGYDRLADELTAMERRIGTKAAASDSHLANALRPRAAWETALERLEAGLLALEAPAKPKEPTRAAAERMVGFTVYASPSTVVVLPWSRPLRSRGGTPKTENVAKLLVSEASYITDHDRRVLSKAKKVASARGRGTEFEIGVAGLLELVGHPNVVDGADRPLSVVLVEPRLVVQQRNTGYVVEFAPQNVLDGIGFSLAKEGRVEVCAMDAGHATLAAATAKGGLVVPKSGKSKLVSVLSTIGARVRVEGLDTDSTLAKAATCDGKIHVHLFRIGRTGLRAALRVAPLGLDGPSIAPGTGASTVIGARNGKPVRGERDLNAERAAVLALQAASPTLAALPSDGSDWATDELEPALELLLALAPVADSVVIAWPDGDAIRTPATATKRGLVVRAGAGRDWFRVDGELTLDDTQVVSMQELIAARTKSQGRFIALDGERYLALTDSVRKQLDALEKTVDHEGKKLRMHPLVLGALESALGLEVEADASVRVRLDKLRNVSSAKVAQPRGFSAELRDYQQEGLAWLVGLGAASAGAILADDMGLGKTVQALALLAHRRKGGPALVVAPTSVVAGWMDQASRFAPNLRLIDFAAGDRESALKRLGASDVLVASYGILHSEREALSALKFHTVIFDEAQALKNTSTLRTRAARALEADFRVALSGTPIENHLVELYSIIDVVIPGLLGTEREFERRYAAPIRAGDRATLGLLRSLVRPFVLRRTKAQVLEELPPRTELIRKVVPSDDERAFYEALRRSAVAVVDAISDRGIAGRMRVLAEIQKLRRAATAPRLVDAKGPDSAKLAELRELIHEIRNSGHRVLVFGQFLDALKSVRADLDAAEIPYQYLDGSTPAKDRATRVAAFQDGEGDVFLISLKAGGTGLNLTGADYVVLMDPWWNPAVEDQAADRVHRIGQTRAVTVIRLVTAGTIEESMIELHGEKRTLAADMLEGMEKAKSIDLGVLTAMIRG